MVSLTDQVGRPTAGSRSVLALAHPIIRISIGNGSLASLRLHILEATYFRPVIYPKHVFVVVLCCMQLPDIFADTLSLFATSKHENTPSEDCVPTLCRDPVFLPDAQRGISSGCLSYLKQPDVVLRIGQQQRCP